MKKSMKPLHIIAAAIGTILLCRCEMQTAGSSVGTGNPTEIQVAFAGDGGTPRGITGTVDVYAATQVPVPGFQPEPLVSFKINGDKEHTVKASDLSAVADSLWPKSSREGDSIYRFNVVVKGDSEGVILRGLGYRPKAPGFAVPDSMKNPGGKDGAVMVWADLAKRVDFSFGINPLSLDPLMDSYVFIPGTGYIAKENKGQFTLSSIPKGKYDPAFISLWKKGQGTNNTWDTVYVYGLKSSIDTEKPDTLSVGAKSDSLLLPLQYRQ